MCDPNHDDDEIRMRLAELGRSARRAWRGDGRDRRSARALARRLSRRARGSTIAATVRALEQSDDERKR